MPGGSIVPVQASASAAVGEVHFVASHVVPRNGRCGAGASSQWHGLVHAATFGRFVHSFAPSARCRWVGDVSVSPLLQTAEHASRASGLGWPQLQLQHRPPRLCIDLDHRRIMLAKSSAEH